MLKMIGSPDKPAPNKNNGSRLVSSRNNNSRPASRRNNNNGEVNKFGVSGNGMKHAKKSRKLSKSENLSKSKQSKGKKLSKFRKLLKIRKLSKSQKSAKLRKELSKSGNLPNFDTKENKPSFLIPNAKTAFNHLRLIFIKALILPYFDLECHI